MLLIETYIGPSKVAGTGLFATNAISTGESVWKNDPRGYFFLPRDVSDGMSQPVRQFLREHATLRSEGWFVTWDNSQFINHSDDPNLIFDYAGNLIAARDITAGEELTENYLALGEIEKFPEGDPEHFRAMASAEHARS